MNSILSKATRLGSHASGRPPAAVELSPEGVLAGSLSAPGHPPVYAFKALPAGAFVPSLAEANLVAKDAVVAAIRSALDQVSPRSRAVTLILPDILVRVFILDFDTLSHKPEEAYPVLRFRLRKMVPFEVEHAGLSYQILSENRDECRVLVAVIPGPVLTEFEAAVRAAGYEPGAVVPSSLTSLEVVDSMEAVLAVNLSSHTLTTSITNGNDLLLYRTLDLPEDAGLRLTEVQRGIAVAAAYYEDKLQARPSSLRYAGNREGSEFARWIEDPELTVIDLAPHPETGALTSLGNLSIAGIAGALAGAH